MYTGLYGAHVHVIAATIDIRSKIEKDSSTRPFDYAFCHCFFDQTSGIADMSKHVRMNNNNNGNNNNKNE